MSGKVTLIGAGPNDLGLLTVKALDELKQAEVVIYDRLVGKDILDLIPENAEKIDAGKKSSNHKIPQSEINELLLQKALDGKKVVRLKGGDCFLFGRGAEELELLADNNIEFQVIPGVSSAFSVPAYAGIPITHRDFVSSVHIITGHQKENEPLKINFKSCVECAGTLIFLMGVSNIREIMNGLIINGMNPNMPCAIIENGTTSKQRKIIGNISNIEMLSIKENIKSPAIIVVGEVCNFSDKFDWFSKLPLKNKTIAVTRPKDRNRSFLQKLKNLGAEVIEFPCIKTKSLINSYLLENIINKINSYNVIVFTSPTGVKFVFDKLFENKIDGRIFFGKKIAVIGSATFEELKKYGLFADYMPKTFDGKSLGKLISENEKDKKILLLRAKDASSEIIEQFEKYNINYLDLPIYYTEFLAYENEKFQKQIIEGKVDFITFTSASTVKGFVSNIQNGYDKFTGICIGEKTNEQALKFGIKTIMSKKASIDEMINTILKEVKKCQ